MLAIFRSPAPRRPHLKFEQYWPEALEENSFEILNIFPIQMGSYKCIGSKLDFAVKSLNVNVRINVKIILATLVLVLPGHLLY